MEVDTVQSTYKDTAYNNISVIIISLLKSMNLCIKAMRGKTTYNNMFMTAYQVQPTEF